MAKCNGCQQEMLKAKSCSYQLIKIGEEYFFRDTYYFDVNKRCHDCGIVNKRGNYHHFGCDIERCPKCKGQLISCDCEDKELIIVN